MRRSILLASLPMLALASPAPAQLDRPRAWTGNLAAGYSTPQGIAGELCTAGFTFLGGATYTPRHLAILGAWVEAGYNGYDVNEATLDTIGVGNGDLRIWSVTGGLRLGTRTRGRTDFYFTLGGGWYQWEVDLLNPSEFVLAPGCSPWWDFCQGPAVLPASEIVGSVTTIDVGVNGGFGLTFALRSGRQIYTEVKYHYVKLDGKEPIEMVPLVVGYRW
jgi:hypothetical protein